MVLPNLPSALYPLSLATVMAYGMVTGLKVRFDIRRPVMFPFVIM
jgi:hypothetical protein